MNTLKKLLVSFLLIELVALLWVISSKSYDVFDDININLKIITANVKHQEKDTTLVSIVEQDKAIRGLIEMQFGNQLYVTHAKEHSEKLAFEDRMYMQSRYITTSIEHLETEVKVMAKKKIETTAKKELGKRYVWGATGPKTFDCSGFTMKVFRKAGINLPRVSRSQAKVGAKVAFNDLQRGDMVFFDTQKHRTGRVNHVGIYLEDGKFIHASSGNKKVVITSFDKKKFYKNRFLWGRRVIQEKIDYTFDSLSMTNINTLLGTQSSIDTLSVKSFLWDNLLSVKSFSFNDIKKRVMASL